jgi:hypothetical protein
LASGRRVCSLTKKRVAEALAMPLAPFRELFHDPRGLQESAASASLAFSPA